MYDKEFRFPNTDGKYSRKFLMLHSMLGKNFSR